MPTTEAGVAAIFQQAHPSAHRDAEVHLLADSPYPTGHLIARQCLIVLLGSHKILACSTKHDTCAMPVPRHAHQHRPSFILQCKACVQMYTSGPCVVPRTLRCDARGLRVLRICVVLLGAAGF